MQPRVQYEMMHDSDPDAHFSPQISFLFIVYFFRTKVLGWNAVIAIEYMQTVSVYV